MGLTVRRVYAYALDTRLQTVLNPPSRSSVTLWEDTAPVKLTVCHGPPPGFTGPVLDVSIPKGGVSLTTQQPPKGLPQSLPLTLSMKTETTVTEYS